LLFGAGVSSINFQLIYCLLSGEYLSSTKENFQKSLSQKFDQKKINTKGFLGKILKKYPINFSMFDFEKVTCYMRQISSGGAHAKRKMNFIDCF